MNVKRQDADCQAASPLLYSAPAAPCGAAAGGKLVPPVLSTACPCSCCSPGQSAPSALTPPDAGRTRDNRWVSTTRSVLPINSAHLSSSSHSCRRLAPHLNGSPAKACQSRTQKSTGTCRP